MTTAWPNVTSTTKKQPSPTLAQLTRLALATTLLVLLPAIALAAPVQLHVDPNEEAAPPDDLGLNGRTGDDTIYTPGNSSTSVTLKRYSDLIIGVAYFAIPVEIAVFAFRLPTLNGYQKSVVGLFFAFIILCGVGHAFEARQMQWSWVVCNRVATAIVSAITAVLSPHVLYKIVNGVQRSLDESRLVEKQRDMLNDAQALTHLGSWEMGEFGTFQLLEMECSDEWFHILGIAPPADKRVPFDRYLDCVDPAERVAIQDAIKNASITGECFNFTQRVHRESDGREVYLRVFGKPLDGAARHLKGRLRGTAQDITTQVISERELVRAKEAAIMEAKHKDIFLANVSHELRTPLTSICGHVDLMGETDLSSLQQEYMRSAKSAAATLLAVINDILDVSKLMAGKVEIDPQVAALDDLLTDIHAITRDLGREDVELKIHSDTGLYVCLDSSRLRQILLNLVSDCTFMLYCSDLGILILDFVFFSFCLFRLQVSNAIKFSRGRKGTVEVTCHYTLPAPDTANITLAVRDTGIGISPAALSRLFQPFMQADASISRRFGGTGLGLSIVKKLVTAMGGQIRVESSEGVGSCFTVELTAPVAARPIVPVPQVYSASGMRILIAEDNPVTQKLLTRMLKPCEIVLADNGAIAVDLIRSGEKFEVMLSDVNMPVMDGLSATRAIRQLPAGRNLYIIGLTANGFKKDRDECIAAGMDAYLSKPFTKAGILSAINQARDRAPTILVNGVNGVNGVCPLPDPLSFDIMSSSETLANSRAPSSNASCGFDTGT
ncbi:hypothetical protein HDU87_004882 [Geranomyces variabilis]|uniref:histidine kinase n=1 Tax=Geranomyces variabilis TaxID=109894 RepID=A0AAD5XLJ6_9FUNG|nr:hypothetical protein HDU87_004882 [Geranomyces variabilis]